MTSTQSMLRAVALAAGLASVGTAHAQLFSSSYNTGLLPSAQGWGYYAVNSSLTEAQVYSTSGGLLTSNTMGNGFQGQGGNFTYTSASTGSFTANQDWVVEARVRVLEGERVSFYYGFCIGAAFDGMTASVGIMPNAWQDSALVAVARDNTGWATWRIETDRQNGTFDLFVDGTLLATRGLAFGPNGAPYPDHYTFLGDGTGGANARAQVESFTFTQVPIPTPGAAALLGLGGLMASRRRRA